MSEVANIWYVDQRDYAPSSALLRSPTVIILFLGLWGFNVAILDRFGLSYRRAFGLNDWGGKSEGGNGGTEMMKIKDSNKANKKRGLESAKSALEVLEQVERGGEGDKGDEDNDEGELLLSSTPLSPSIPSLTSDIILVSISLLVLLYLTQLTWINLFSGGVLGASAMFYAYTAVFVLSSSPDSLGGRVRVKVKVLLEILWEILVGGRDFVHVFVADALCSLSKVFFDQGLLLTLAIHYPNHIPRSSKSLIIPALFASSPYLIRTRQVTNSWINFENKQDPMRHMHILNGIKYLSSVVPIVLLTMQQLEDEEKSKLAMEDHIIFSLVVNTIFTFCWDTFVDWGLGSGLSAGFNFCEVGPGSASPGKKAKKGRDCCIRQGIKFGSNATAVAIAINLFLRCAWMLRFSTLALTEDQFILLSQFLEVFRRSLWNLFRIEWQLVTMNNRKEMRA